ncbi:MAG: nitroreductase family protein [Candidatus Zixiibacteriota bacterium]
MNDALEFLNSHTSVRQFTDQAVSTDDERRIVETAERSPTSSNLHAYSIIGIRDQGKKDKLAELCGGQGHVAKSSLFLVFCADLFRLSRLCEQRGYRHNSDTAEMFIIATVDAALAAGRALMAAQALGMGGVMVGGIRDCIADVSSLLDLPELTSPVMGMSLGYPVSPAKTKPRLPIDGLYFREQYRPEQIDTAVDEYDSTIERMGYLRGREVEPELYPNFSGRYSWSEHSARRMATTEPGALRAHMLPFLHKQGLMLK